jgi:hypothetical protein
MRPSVLSLVNQRESELTRCGSDNRHPSQPIERMTFTQLQQARGSANYSTTRTIRDCRIWGASLCDPPPDGSVRHLWASNQKKRIQS